METLLAAIAEHTIDALKLLVTHLNHDQISPDLLAHAERLELAAEEYGAQRAEAEREAAARKEADWTLPTEHTGPATD